MVEICKNNQNPTPTKQGLAPIKNTKKTAMNNIRRFWTFTALVALTLSLSTFVVVDDPSTAYWNSAVTKPLLTSLGTFLMSHRYALTIVTNPIAVTAILVIIYAKVLLFEHNE